MVAAGHRLSARAGAEALARGGGAVDAVCAAAFAAAVAESPLTGPGAGGFLLVRSPAGETALLDFFVAAPGLGPDGRRLDPGELDSFTVPFGGADQVFHIGPASVAVPGMVAGLGEAVRRFGRLSLSEVVAPAVALAREGVVLTRETGYLHEILADMLTATPAAAAVYAPGGHLLGPGERVRFADLAETLVHLGETGPSTMRDGPLAEALVAHMAESGGHVTAEDLRSYRVLDRTPLRFAYRDTTVLTNPPPSSGGALIAAALAVMEEGARPASEADHYRAVTRAGLAANALRDETFLADLHEEDCMERLWARRTERGRDAGPGESRKPAGSTTHVSAIDADGGMASLSSSNGSGSGVVIPGTGILLNNMMGEEDLNPAGFGHLEPGHPDDLDDGAEPAAAGRRAGHRARLGRVQPPAIGHPPDRGEHGRRGPRRRGRRAPPARAPGGRRRRRRGWRARGGRGGADRRWPPAEALGRGQPLLRRRERGRTRGGRARGRRGSPPRRRRRGTDESGRGGRSMTQHRVEVEGREYDLEPGGLRTSLTDGPSMLWGFQVRVLSDGEELGIKTCFVGRVSVQFRNPAAPDAPIEILMPVLHELAFEKVEERLRLGETGDEILFT